MHCHITLTLLEGGFREGLTKDLGVAFSPTTQRAVTVTSHNSLVLFYHSSFETYSPRRMSTILIDRQSYQPLVVPASLFPSEVS